MLPSSNGVDFLYNTLPPEVPTLAEQLQHGGYATAGLVNDGQMQALWGFARGYDQWREFARAVQSVVGRLAAHGTPAVAR